MDKLQERINKGRAAKRILEDEGVDKVLTEIGAEWTGQALSNCITSPETSVTMLRQVTTLEVLRSKLQAIVANGREAEREMQRLNPT